MGTRAVRESQEVECYGKNAQKRGEVKTPKRPIIPPFLHVCGVVAVWGDTFPFSLHCSKCSTRVLVFSEGLTN